jgi:hypothetical protein
MGMEVLAGPTQPGPKIVNLNTGEALGYYHPDCDITNCGPFLVRVAVELLQNRDRRTAWHQRLIDGLGVDELELQKGVIALLRALAESCDAPALTSFIDAVDNSKFLDLDPRVQAILLAAIGQQFVGSMVQPMKEREILGTRALQSMNLANILKYAEANVRALQRP